jgi:curved DNA-binding protein CbpA
MDPYAELGVNRDAPIEVVRRAYRKAAKRAHPDHGGSTDAFTKLNRALKVLTDPERRAHYDRTGEDAEPKPDGTETRAMQTAFQALGNVIANLQAQSFNPETMDVLGMAVKDLGIVLGKMESIAKQARANADKATKLGKRFKARRGKPDIIGPMWAAHVAGLEQQVVTALADKPVVERAIAILKDHEFEVLAREAAPYGRPLSPFATMLQSPMV